MPSIAADPGYRGGGARMVGVAGEGGAFGFWPDTKSGGGGGGGGWWVLSVSSPIKKVGEGGYDRISGGPRI